MKRTICMLMALMLMAASLTACGLIGGEKTPAGNQSTPAASASQLEGKTVTGIINKINNYLVLLTDDGEYQIMDYGEGVTMDGFTEGDKVDVTYTGQLGVEGTTPVITSITKVG